MPRIRIENTESRNRRIKTACLNGNWKESPARLNSLNNLCALDNYPDLHIRVKIMASSYMSAYTLRAYILYNPLFDCCYKVNTHRNYAFSNTSHFVIRLTFPLYSGTRS